MEISSLIRPGYKVAEGLMVPPDQADSTVWDTLSQSDLLDAATSAESEAHAIEKGMPQIDELAVDANDGIVLDVGCGYGRIAEQLLPRRDFEGYIGVDSSLSMLRYARDRKTSISVNTPMHFVYGQIDDLPLADNSVDTVVVSAVFLHNHKSVTKRSISEIFRVLKPGGKVFVYSSFPSLHSLMGYQVALYLWFMKLFADEYRNGPVRYFSRSEVSKLFSEYGEVNIRSFGFTIIPKRILFLPSFINRGYRVYFSNPLNHLIRKLLPTSMEYLFPTHHDVVAKK